MLKDGTANWEALSQNTLPAPRESHASTILKEKFILIYGGNG
jgi:hypothetical protein